MKYLVVLLSASLMSCSHLSDWKKNGTREQVVLQKNWVRSTLSSINLAHKKINRARPILVGDLLIQANGIDGLTAFDKRTGSRVWKLNIENGVEAPGAIINQRLFFPANDGFVYSVDALSGEIIWKFDSKFENLGEPLIHEGQLYFLTGNNIIFSVDASTGKQSWVYARQDSASFTIRGASRPVIFGDSLFVGFSDGSVVALQAKTGAIRWENQLNRNKKFRDIDSNLVIDSGQLLVSGYDDKLYALDPTSGEIRWRIDGGSYTGPTIYKDFILYPVSTGEVVCLDKKNGNRLWSYSKINGIPTSIEVFDDKVIFGESQGALILLDIKDGRKLTEFEPGRGVLSGLAVDREKALIFFISGDANAYSLRIAKDKMGPWPLSID